MPECQACTSHVDLDCSTNQFITACDGQRKTDVVCANCDPSCISCVGPYNTQCSGSVATACQFGYFSSPPSAIGITCRQCHSACVTCSGGSFDQCTGSVCSSGFFLSGTTTCMLCAPGCGTCKGPSSCQTCLSGYLIEADGLCVQENGCAVGEYLGANNHCLSCINNCLTCISASVCQTCPTRFFLNPTSGSCVSVGSCLTSTYADSTTNRCVSSCPTALPLVNSAGTACVSTCTSSEWQLLGETSQCKACSNSLLLDCARNQFTTACDGQQTANVVCANCDISCGAGCNGPYNTQCVDSCNPGYFASPPTLQGIACLKCHPGCITCSGPSFEQCTGSICSTGFYLLGASTCAICASGCLTCQGLNSCQTCLPGYLLEATGICELENTCAIGEYLGTKSNCLACINNCLTCASATICLSCVSTFYFDPTTSTCMSVTDCPGNTYADSTTNRCVTSCPAALPLINSAGTICTSTCAGAEWQNFGGTPQCKACTSAVVLNCQNNQFITGCNGQQTSDNVCASCDVSCAAGCNGPYNTQCVGSCQVGYFVASITPSGSMCQECSPACVTCSGATFDQCTGSVCSSGFFLSGTTTCMLCAPGCATCRGPNSCQICLPGYLIETSGLCTQENICAVGEYVVSKGTCHSCVNNCLTCTSTTVCLTCPVNFYFRSSTSTCVPAGSCSVNTYADSTTNRCVSFCPAVLPLINSDGVACVVGCASTEWVNFGQCKSCTASFVLNCSTTQFITVCDGQQLSDNVCAGCDSSCATGCNGPYNTQCIGSATTACQSGFFVSSRTSSGMTCLPCDASCSACTGPSHAQCKPSSCSVGFFQSGLTSCAECPIGCSTCISSNFCTGCLAGYLLETSNICVFEAICQNSEYVDSNYACHSCDASCVSCSAGGNTACSGSCAANYFASATLNGLTACLPCDPSCNGCTSSNSSCIACAANYRQVASFRGVLTCNAHPAVSVSIAFTDTASTNPSLFGQALRFSATVISLAPLYFTPMGFIQFAVDNVPMGLPASLYPVGNEGVVAGAVSSTIASLAIGTHTISATWSGDVTGQSIGTITQVVNKGASPGLRVNAPSVLVGSSVVISISVQAPIMAVATGTIQVFINSQLVTTAEVVNGSCVVTIEGQTPERLRNLIAQPGGLAAGNNFVVVVYSGNEFYGSSSNADSPITLVIAPCPSNCLACYGSPTAAVCGVCQLGAFLNAGKCSSCGTQCSNCTNAATCNICNPGIFLNTDNSCVQACPSATFIQDFSCIACGSDCLTCSGRSECSVCAANMFLFQQQCVTVCPSGFSVAEFSQQCYSTQSFTMLLGLHISLTKSQQVAYLANKPSFVWNFIQDVSVAFVPSISTSLIAVDTVTPDTAPAYGVTVLFSILPDQYGAQLYNMSWLNAELETAINNPNSALHQGNVTRTADAQIAATTSSVSQCDGVWQLSCTSNSSSINNSWLIVAIIVIILLVVLIIFALVYYKRHHVKTKTVKVVELNTPNPHAAKFDGLTTPVSINQPEIPKPEWLATSASEELELTSPHAGVMIHPVDTGACDDDLNAVHVHIGSQKAHLNTFGSEASDVKLV
jgi:hypothetical protein